MVDVELGEVEPGDPAHQVDGRVVGPRERLGQRGDHLPIRRTVEAAETNVDRMDRPATDHLHDVVADLLEAEHVRDELGMAIGELQPRAGVEEVGRMEEADVQDVALDPFAGVEQPTQLVELTVDGHPGDPFECGRRGHLVGDRADPTDACGDVDRFTEAAPAQERLEESRWLVDLQAEVGDHVVANFDVQRTLAFDAGECGDPEVDVLVGHGAASRSHPLNPCQSRSRSRWSSPSRSSWRSSVAVSAVSAGPKHP